MGLILENAAMAYVNMGRWVADCPAMCGGAVELEPKQTALPCGTCGALSVVVWPPDADGIWMALSVRPLPRTRNWFPKDHDLAVRSGTPHGQTVDDLRRETREYMGEETSPFWSETVDNGNEPKKRDCPDCVADIPHAEHWQGLKAQDRGIGRL